MTHRGSRSTQKQMPPRCWREVLDGQPQAPRAGRAEHQPVGSLREVLIGQRVAEQLVVDPEIVARDARLGHAGGAAGLEHVDRLAGAALGDPALHRSAAQPVVLEKTEAPEVVEARDLAPRIPSELLRELQPERATGGRVEMPRDDLADVDVERLALGARPSCEVGIRVSPTGCG